MFSHFEMKSVLCFLEAMSFFFFSVSGHLGIACENRPAELPNWLSFLSASFLCFISPAKLEHLLLSMSYVFPLGEWVVLIKTK